jgi:hypothetical protein
MITKRPEKSKKSISRRERRDAERKDRNIGMVEGWNPKAGRLE